MDWTAIIIAVVGMLTGLITAIGSLVSKAKDRKAVERKEEELKRQANDTENKNIEKVNSKINSLEETVNKLVVHLDDASKNNVNFVKELDLRFGEINNKISNIIKFNAEKERAYLTETYYSIIDRGWCSKELKYLYKDRFIKYKENGFNHVFESWLEEIMLLPEEER